MSLEHFTIATLILAFGLGPIRYQQPVSKDIAAKLIATSELTSIKVGRGSAPPLTVSDERAPLGKRWLHLIVQFRPQASGAEIKSDAISVVGSFGTSPVVAVGMPDSLRLVETIWVGTAIKQVDTKGADQEVYVLNLGGGVKLSFQKLNPAEVGLLFAVPTNAQRMELQIAGEPPMPINDSASKPPSR